MTRSKARERSFSVLDMLIAIVTLGIGIVVVIAADRDQLLVSPPKPVPVERRVVSRPDWVWDLAFPYERITHDYSFAIAFATLGVGAILATDRTTWTRRGLSRPGTLAVVVALTVGAF